MQELWQPSLPLRGRVLPEGGVRLCDYYTKWSEDGLRALHMLFKAMRLRSAEAAAAFVPARRRRHKHPVAAQSVSRAVRPVREPGPG